MATLIDRFYSAAGQDFTVSIACEYNSLNNNAIQFDISNGAPNSIRLTVWDINKVQIYQNDFAPGVSVVPAPQGFKWFPGKASIYTLSCGDTPS